MKKFIIVGPTTALMYLNVFALIKEGKLYTGVTHPQKFDNWGSTVKEMNGNTIQWYENVARVKFNAPQLTKKYNAEEYPKFDNIEAINIDRVKNIPYDYEGVIGVPITFLSWYYPQYEIIGLENHGGKCGPMVNGKAKFARVLIKKS